MPEPLLMREIRNNSRLHIGKTLHYFEEIDSTNQEAERRIKSGKANSGDVVIAEHQMIGKGRFERKWWSAPCQCLLASVIVSPEISSADSHCLTCLGALAVRETCGKFASPPPTIRWPNDLIRSNRKLAGVLAKAVQDSQKKLFYIIGIGVNVNVLQDEFPEELRNIAISMQMLLNEEIDRTSFAKKLLDNLDSWYINMIEGKSQFIESMWRDSSSLMGRCVRLISGDIAYEGEVFDVSLARGIGLRTSDGFQKYFSEENVQLLR